MALVAFLDLNGTDLMASDRAAVDLIQDLASCALTEAEVARWVRELLR